MFFLTACHIYCTIVCRMIYDAATAAPLRSTNANVTLLLLTQTLSHFSYTCCGYVREWCACVCVCPNDVYATNQPTFNYVAPPPPSFFALLLGINIWPFVSFLERVGVDMF